LARKVSIRATLTVPGDKSISHRALIFSTLCRGTVIIKGLSPAEDCQSTLECLAKLGVKSTKIAPTVENPALAECILESPGLDGLAQPKEVLNAGNSGTTMRLLSGLVAGRPFTTRFDGDASLRMRPMSRVLLPLYEMGAQVHYQSSQDMAPVSDTAPFSITGGNLKGSEFVLKVASAQVQTCILLAGLQADGKTTVTMPAFVRDHTERMFEYIKVPFGRRDNGSIEVTRLVKPLAPYEVTVPGDLSSAAFFIVAAACLPGSDLLLKNVGLNPGRKLVIDVLQRMGAEIIFEDIREAYCEPVADIRVRYKGRLKGVTVSGEEVASGIDEIPILALAGCTCEGTFVVRGAEELRHKESDRLKAMVENIQDMGITVENLEDGFIIDGVPNVPGASLWRTYNDHRMAMTGLIANCLSEEPIQLEETGSIKISYPRFEDQLALLVDNKA